MRAQNTRLNLWAQVDRFYEPKIMVMGRSINMEIERRMIMQNIPTRKTSSVCKGAICKGLMGALVLPAIFSVSAASAIDVREVISQTLATNPRVLAELREANARERQVRQALAGYYPVVDLVAGFGFQERDPTSRTFSSPTRTRNELERREAQLNIRQLVFDGFQTTNEYRNQQAREESAKQRARSVGEDVALEVVQVFTEILKTKETLVLAEDTLAFHEEVFGRMQQRFDSGVGSKADLDQIAGRLALAKTNLAASRANLRDAIVNYHRTVGVVPNQDDLDPLGSYRKYLPANIEEAVQKANQNHPIMMVANADVEATTYRYEQTKSAFYPQFHFELERDLNDNIDGIETQVDDLKVMLRMRYNLYRGRADQARKQEFAFLVEQAKEIRNNAMRQVEQELRLAWIAHATLQDQLPSLRDHVRDAGATKDAYKDQFDLGRRTLLDLLNTETEKVSAEQSLIAAQYDVIYNEYRIFQSMGELMYMVGAKLSS
jgi:adhesin transport system outer membrane protein